MKQDSLTTLIYDPAIFVSEAYADEQLHIFKSGFEGYPVHCHETDTMIIAMEGIIYNHPLEKIIHNLEIIGFSRFNQEVLMGALNTFVSDADGEYVIFLYFKPQQTWFIFTDKNGALPCYYMQTAEGVIISREIKFLLHYLEVITFNKPAMIEYLIRRFVFNDRTLIDGINSVRANQLLYVNGNPHYLQSRSIRSITYEDKQASASWITSLSWATRHFLTACKNRVKHPQIRAFKLWSDLSGGYDSRLVASAIAQYYPKLLAISFNLPSINETLVAKEVAKTLNLSYSLISPSYCFTDPDTLQAAIFNADCSGSVRTILMTYQQKHLLQEMPRKAECQGYGGDILRKGKRARPFYHQITDIILDLISPSFFLRACRCLAIDPKDLRRFWMLEFPDWYAETDIHDQFFHFQHDYQMLYVNKAIDRDRIWYWPLNPMQAWVDWVRDQLPRQYIGYRFFNQIQEQINPQVSMRCIPSSKPVPEIPSKRGRLLRWVKNQGWSRAVGKTLYHLSARYELNFERDFLREQIRIQGHSKLAEQYFDWKQLLAAVQHEPYMIDLWQIFSLLLYMKAIEKRFPDKVKK